jgi:hypothetical protein
MFGWEHATIMCLTAGVQSPAGAMMGLFLLATASRPALGPTQHLIQLAPRALFPGTKRPGREANGIEGFILFRIGSIVNAIVELRPP